MRRWPPSIHATASALTQQGSTITAFAGGQSDITFNDQAGSRTIAGTKFLTQGSVIPQILVDPTQPGLMYVVTVQDPNAAQPTRRHPKWSSPTLTQNSNGTLELDNLDDLRRRRRPRPSSSSPRPRWIPAATSS